MSQTRGNIQADLLFEVSSEVINKVGGIFTVIKSKAHVTAQEYGKRYFLLGSYNEHQCRQDLEPCAPEQPEVVNALNQLRSEDVKVQQYSHPVNIVGHFHEWISAIGLILIQQTGVEMSTVFTTHATLLGRHLSAGQVDLQYVLHNYFDCDQEAANRGFYYRYCIEKVAANIAHVFTTVSKTTADEAERFLGRYPDLVTPNGMACDANVATETLQKEHRSAKEKIHDFVRGHFYGHLSFDLGKTLYMFLAGRYEYYNKGCDFFIEALARLNHRLQCEGTDVTVVAFIIMPAATNGYNRASLQGQLVRKQLQKAAEQLRDIFPPTMVNSCLSGMVPDFDGLSDSEEMDYLKACFRNVAPDTEPPICTHNMVDDVFDPVLNEIRRCQLFNSKADRVKVIFHAEFLSPSSPVLPMGYDEFVNGCHLGVFPSAYEPWGYTPAECAIMGVPSVTTNLSGFGCFIADFVPDPDDYGIFIINRKSQSIEQAVEQLTCYLHRFTQQTQTERGQQRRKTELLRRVLDWRTLGVAYTKARCTAIQIHTGVVDQPPKKSTKKSFKLKLSPRGKKVAPTT
ncbi:Glycogen [starch] synthase, muscle [Hypsibius exemplaris]|uniref:Glycogen [starch] synthase n=1 Tax=Hypsibius exemplaris TaxID=2072580 RepID=A0A1W0X1R8_HYPEX|nr:Glycogen [starch] synthase, muscle [Hypsibius exemplaris]